MDAKRASQACQIDTEHRKESGERRAGERWNRYGHSRSNQYRARKESISKRDRRIKRQLVARKEAPHAKSSPTRSAGRSVHAVSPHACLLL
jgi:hypothetical protein